MVPEQNYAVSAREVWGRKDGLAGHLTVLLKSNQHPATTNHLYPLPEELGEQDSNLLHGQTLLHVRLGDALS